MELAGVKASFDVGVGFPSEEASLLNSSGKFNLNVGRLEVEVPQVFNLTATDIRVAYDPQGAADQQLVVVNSINIDFPRLNASARITPFDPSGNRNVELGNNQPLPTGWIPGLVVRRNGFRLGQAELCYGCAQPSSNERDPAKRWPGGDSIRRDSRV